MIPTLYEKRYPLPRVGFVTNKQWGGKVLSLGLKQEPPPLGNPRNCLPAVQNEAGENSCGYTFPSAYAFARARGTPVVYGMDYAIGSLDFVGLRGDHSENRFRQELLWLRSVWIPGTVVHGRVSLKILDYLNSK
jgi:hypothetical protein